MLLYSLIPVVLPGLNTDTKNLSEMVACCDTELGSFRVSPYFVSYILFSYPSLGTAHLCYHLRYWSQDWCIVFHHSLLWLLSWWTSVAWLCEKLGAVDEVKPRLFELVQPTTSSNPPEGLAQDDFDVHMFLSISFHPFALCHSKCVDRPSCVLYICITQKMNTWRSGHMQRKARTQGVHRSWNLQRAKECGGLEFCNRSATVG